MRNPGRDGSSVSRVNATTKESLMIRTEGTLLVKKIKQSRNGPFCVADLVTDFGEFKVKDSLLDQFAEGEYRGMVWISEIYLAQYVSFGRGVTELRARLHDIQVDTESSLPAKSANDSEPDPLDEPPLLLGHLRFQEHLLALHPDAVEKVRIDRPAAAGPDAVLPTGRRQGCRSGGGRRGRGRIACPCGHGV